VALFRPAQMKIRYILLCVITIAAALTVAWAQKAKVTRAYADENGAMHVIYDDGREKIIHKQRDTMGVGDVKIARDGQTVGWIVDWPNPDAPNGTPIPGTLVIWRNGKVVRKFAPGPVAFWGWNFWDGGTRVAYELGAMHFSNGNYELRDIAAGRLLARYYCNDWDQQHCDPGEMPDWAKAIPVH